MQHICGSKNNAAIMKAYFLCALLLSATAVNAQKMVTVDSGMVTTVPGIGGNAQIGYAFAKGDVVTIDAKASKLLERMMVFRFPEQVLGRVKYSKKAKFSFTMPEEGIAVFRFISDRDGTNKITYMVTRVPASAAVQEYDTKVDWKMPVDHAGTLIPQRAGGGGN